VILHSQKPVVLTASAALVDEGPMPEIPKLFLANPNTLNWRHLANTDFLVIGK